MYSRSHNNFDGVEAGRRELERKWARWPTLANADYRSYEDDRREARSSFPRDMGGVMDTPRRESGRSGSGENIALLEYQPQLMQPDREFRRNPLPEECEYCHKEFKSEPALR
jgi:hypothetical protein